MRAASRILKTPAQIVWPLGTQRHELAAASWAALLAANRVESRAISTQGHAHGSRSSWRTGSSAAAWGASAAALAAAATAVVAQGEAFSSDEPAARSKDQLRAEFAAWVRQHGGHMEGVALDASAQGPSAGHGLFSTPQLRAALRHRWLGRRLGAALTGQRTVPVAEVPLDLALTASSAVRDPELGGSYAELLRLGLLDERSVVVAMVAVERARGGESRYAPWLRLLPER
jgi:hypothetical protein